MHESQEKELKGEGTRGGGRMKQVGSHFLAGSFMRER